MEVSGAENDSEEHLTLQTLHHYLVPQNCSLYRNWPEWTKRSNDLGMNFGPVPSLSFFSYVTMAKFHGL